MIKLIAFLALIATPAFSGPDRVSILIGSQHIGAPGAFNEFNPGVFLTWEQDRWSQSIGVYHNSFGRVSVAAALAYDLVERPISSFRFLVAWRTFPSMGATSRSMPAMWSRSAGCRHDTETCSCNSRPEAVTSQAL